jgi:DMSO reductase family type II enzyme chaperone
VNPDNEMLVEAASRSLTFRAFAEAFRKPNGGAEIFDENVIPPPTAESNVAFVTAFDPAVSDQACSLYEGNYGTRERTALFEELVRWYDLFGLRREEEAELPDHISVQLEFMHFLTFLEGKHGREPETKQSLRKAQNDFLERHLIPFSTRLHEAFQSDDPRCKALVEHLQAFLESDKAMIGACP